MYLLLSPHQLGKRIRERREFLKLSTGTVADMCGRKFTHRTIESYEGGATYPAFGNLIPLLNALDISFDELVCGGEMQKSLL